MNIYIAEYILLLLSKLSKLQMVLINLTLHIKIEVILNLN